MGQKQKQKLYKHNKICQSKFNIRNLIQDLVRLANHTIVKFFLKRYHLNQNKNYINLQSRESQTHPKSLLIINLQIIHLQVSIIKPNKQDQNLVHRSKSYKQTKKQKPTNKIKNPNNIAQINIIIVRLVGRTVKNHSLKQIFEHIIYSFQQSAKYNFQILRFSYRTNDFSQIYQYLNWKQIIMEGHRRRREQNDSCEEDEAHEREEEGAQAVDITKTEFLGLLGQSEKLFHEECDILFEKILSFQREITGSKTPKKVSPKYNQIHSWQQNIGKIHSFN